MGRNKSVYASVKSYSQRGKLLKREDYQMLAESRNLDELVTRMRNTVYESVMADVPKPYTAHGIESAIRGNLAQVHHKISQTMRRSAILDAYYMKFIIFNLKIILKGKVLGKSQEDIEVHVNLRAEELLKQREIVMKALVAKDLEEAVANLSGTRFGEEIMQAATAYNDKKSIQVFDTYFDKILYRHLSRALRDNQDHDVKRIVGLDIDSYNLLCVIRGKFWNLDEGAITDMLVQPTASAPQELLSRMIAAGSVRDTLNELNSTKYKNLIPQADDEMDALAEFEKRVERQIYAASARSFTKMFGFATIIGITKLTGYEAQNLSAIAFAVGQGISPKVTVTKLVFGGE